MRSPEEMRRAGGKPDPKFQQKRLNDISGKEAIQASLFSLALTVYLETVHQPNRSSDKPHCHISKRPTNYPQPVLLLLYGDSAFALLIF